MKKNILSQILPVLLLGIFVVPLAIIAELLPDLALLFGYIFKHETLKEKIRYSIYFLCELLSAFLPLIGLAIFLENGEISKYFIFLAMILAVILPCLLLWLFERLEKKLKDKVAISDKLL